MSALFENIILGMGLMACQGAWIWFAYGWQRSNEYLLEGGTSWELHPFPRIKSMFFSCMEDLLGKKIKKEKICYIKR